MTSKSLLNPILYLNNFLKLNSYGLFNVTLYEIIRRNIRFLIAYYLPTLFFVIVFRQKFVKIDIYRLLGK